MSYFDDWNEIDPEFVWEQSQRQKEIKNNKHIGWTTANGDLIPYSKMTTRHLINCKAMCEKKSPWRKEFLLYLNTELRRRGIL